MSGPRNDQDFFPSYFELQFIHAPSLGCCVACCTGDDIFLRAANPNANRDSSHPQPGAIDADFGL